MITLLQYIFDSLINFVMALFFDVFEIVKDMSFWFFEQVLGLTGWGFSIVKAEFPDVDFAGYWDLVPQEMIQVLDYLDFTTCIGMVVGAMGVRFTLNLIPFVK